MLLFKERDNILKSMEAHNKKLTNAFQKYRQINNMELMYIMKERQRSGEYTQENIRDVFYTLVNPFLSGGYLVSQGNSLEKNDRVKNFKIDNGVIYGDTLDRDNNIYCSIIDMNLLKHKQMIIKMLQGDIINLDNILSILNESKIEIIPTDFHKIKCKCSCNNIDQPCKHTIALYFRFIDNMKINKNIIIELFGIK